MSAPGQPSVMGVLNVTPDSFSDGGRYLTLASALAHARRMVAEGAHVIDVGGESTRPGAVEVDAEVEIARVDDVIRMIVADPDCRGVRVSIDTRHAEVARAAVSAGATLINDVSSKLWSVAAETGVGWIAMHMAGQPATMQNDPHYDDVVAEVHDHLVDAAVTARRNGVTEVWIDPGIGFGKTTGHNLALLAHLDVLVGSGFPVLIGTSRKGLTGVLSRRGDHDGASADGPTPVDDRLEASFATATWAMWRGARMVRVHDVAPHVDAARVIGGSIPRGPGGDDSTTSPVAVRHAAA